MRAIERATAHFAAQGVRSVEVPEWGAPDAPLVIYWKPWTLAERAILHRATAEEGTKGLAQCLILKALDASGDKMFTLEDKEKLARGVDANVLSRVAGRISADVGAELAEARAKDVAGIEEAAKN